MSGNIFVFFWGFSITLLAVAASVSSFEPSTEEFQRSFVIATLKKTAD
jgi:hypothetical protein